MVQAALYNELQKLCHRSFPERLNQSISQVQSLASSRHPLLAFSLAWREGRRPRVERLLVRRYSDPWTWWSRQDHHKAEREWVVVRWLFGLGLPVPRLYASGSESEQSYLLMARAGGKSMLANGHILGNAQGHIEALAALLAQLHHLTPSPAIRDTLPKVALDRAFAQMVETARQCQDSGLLETVLALRALEMEEHPPCVLHSNPRVDNVLCDARGITAVLGWENAALGDPRWDVGRVVHELRAHRADALIEPFCAAYADQSNVPLSNVVYWEALAAVQSWALIEWVHDNAPQDAKELLSERENWRERAWRAFTRFRHTRDDD